MHNKKIIGICYSAFFIVVLLLSNTTSAQAIDGGPTGWWTDSDGNNYYGDPSSSSSSYDSSSSSSSYDSSGYSATSNAASGLVNSFMEGFNRGRQRAAYREPTAEELEMERNVQMAQASRNSGTEAYNRRDFDKAIEYYEQALQFCPTDGGISDSLNMARASKANAEANKYFDEGNLEMAVKLYQEAMGHRANNTIRENLKKAEDMLQAERVERIRNEQIAEAKERVGTMLDDMAGSMGSSGQAGGSGASSLDFIGSEEPRYSKGSKASTPVDLSFMDFRDSPNAGKAKEPAPAAEKGVSYKEVPSPGTIRQQDLPLFAKDRTNIVLDAFKYGKGDLNKSIRHLEDNKGLTEQPNLQEAISYIEGIRDAENTIVAKKPAAAKKNEDQASSDAIEETLMLMVANSGKRTVVWPGQKNPDAGSRIPNPLDWKEERLNIAAEGLIHGNGSWDKSIDYLKDKTAKENSKGSYNGRTYQAIQYLEGIRAYGYYKEAEKKRTGGNKDASH